MLDRLIIHIGKHKTGSTSFQRYLESNREAMASCGIICLPQRLSDLLSAVCVRNGLVIPPSVDLEGTNPGVIHAHLISEIEAITLSNEFAVLIMSCEHLSYFREDSEVNKLNEFLPASKSTEVIFVKREERDFLESYLLQVLRSGHGPSEEVDSAFYCGQDSWLADDDAIYCLWSRHFSKGHSIAL